jgi:hypothetical protein
MAKPLETQTITPAPGPLSKELRKPLSQETRYLLTLFFASVVIGLIALAR